MVHILRQRDIRIEHPLIDASSLHRPDTSWHVVDASGHEHRWYVDGTPTSSYNPTAKYETPTLVWIKDGEEYWDDDEQPHDVGHLECRQCGEHIEPRYTSDSFQQMIPSGMVRWGIKDAEVDADSALELTQAFQGNQKVDILFGMHARTFRGDAIVTDVRTISDATGPKFLFQLSGVSTPLTIR